MVAERAYQLGSHAAPRQSVKGSVCACLGAATPLFYTIMISGSDSNHSPSLT